MNTISKNDNLINMSVRIGRIASMAGALSDAAVHSPNDPSEYIGAMEMLACVLRDFADDFAVQVNG